MAVGVITHLLNVSFDELRALARAVEAAGADWLGTPDAFWWRDGWILLAAAAQVTERVEIGPMVTNPYLRHPFHTVSAMATLQDLAGPRVFLGVAAGGSEVSGAAGVSRAGAPLDPRSGRVLEVPLLPAPILVAGRGDGMLRAAGRVGDRAMLWAVPQSDLDRSAEVVAAGARAGREGPGDKPELVWAPLVDHGGPSRARVRSIAAYSVLNSRPELQARWGLSSADVARLRELLVGGGAKAAADLVPAAALEDLIIADAEPANVGAIARRIGATSLALPAFSTAELPERVAWARQVLATR
jgi:5,10-methylenetetrahydromethanopterin reductase